MSWTEERKERAKKLWTDGWSASQIAGDLGGVTRNAVIGALSRMGAPKRNTLAPRRSHVPAAPRKTRERKVYFKPMFAGMGSVQMLEAIDEVFEERVADVVPQNLSILALTDETCRFPYGDGEETPFTFCGHPPKEDSRYCPQHHEICIGVGRSISDEEAARRSAAQKRSHAKRTGNAWA